MKENQTQESSDQTVFTNSSISRRQFVRLSAATAGAVALPGQATAELASSTLTDEYQYAINHTDEREHIPTLITFSEEAGLDHVDELDLPLAARTTTEPTVAAHAYLTTVQVEDLVDIESVTELQFSPGSNPFWLLDYYPEGVFPSPEDSVDYIDYERLSQGMDYLIDQHPNRLRFESIVPVLAIITSSRKRKTRKTSGLQNSRTILLMQTAFRTKRNWCSHSPSMGMNAVG